MAVNVKFRQNTKSARLIMRELRRDIQNKVIVRALNKTAVTVRSEASKEIRKTYAIKAGTVRNAIEISRARPSYLVATVSASGRALPVYDFGARQTKAGVTVRIRKDEGRKLLRGTFIAKMPTGHVGVFARKPEADEATGKDRHGRPRKHRLPIQERRTLSIPNAFVSRSIRATLIRVARRRYNVVLAQEIKFASQRVSS